MNDRHDPTPVFDDGSAAFSEQDSSETAGIIASALAETGRIILDGALPRSLSDRLLQRALELERTGALHRAGIGRQLAHHRSDAVRTDQTAWMESDDEVERAYLEWMEQLRLELNRRLFLGLFDYEAHFAVYEPGAYYRRHLDAFQGQRNRVVTTVFYLNADWDPDNGGELIIYPEQGEAPLQRVLPEQGRLVVFLSDQFPHEVQPALRTRYSIAGWFRLNAGGSRRADPPR